MSAGPGVIRKSVGRQLKALRVAAGKTSADVVASGIASKAKLQRIEGGKGTIRTSDARSLCWLYGADQSTTDRLAELALNTAAQGFWEDYGDIVPAWFGMFVELESAASRLLAYDPELVLGLLQTPGYHRGLIEVDPERSHESMDQQLRLRVERQRAAFERPVPLEVVVVLGAGVLARLVGGPEVAEEQNQRLLELAGQSHIEVRVLPWEAGAHVAMKGAFNILEFADDDAPDVVYLETLAGGRYIEKADMVDRYRRNLDLVIGQSVSIKEYMR